MGGGEDEGGEEVIALDSRELVSGWGGCWFGSTNLRCWIRIVSTFWKRRAKAWSELERRTDLGLEIGGMGSDVSQSGFVYAL